MTLLVGRDLASRFGRLYYVDYWSLWCDGTLPRVHLDPDNWAPPNGRAQLDACELGTGKAGRQDPSTPLPIDTGFLVNSRGCRIPAMDPFDRHVQRFIYREEPPNCAKERPPPLVGSNLTALFVIESALPYYNVSDVAQLDCCYQPFWRVRENKVA
uniref:Uncharacterized protein n=1 Tax=Timema poppense TaxID=170557 RepID=A0A7R9HCD1_TIMPO|nr:unnamed protein product [Timema poppensis]